MLTNRTSFKTQAADGIVDADGFASLGQNYIIDSNNAIVAVAPVYSKIIPAVTLAQLNAGLTLIADIPGRTIVVTSYLLVFNGSFTTATDIRLQDSNGTPVVISTVLIAAATAGASISSDNTISNVTNGAGCFASLTAGKGVQIVKTGSAAAGGTSILVKLEYNVI
jgi:hypothetical protein